MADPNRRDHPVINNTPYVFHQPPPSFVFSAYTPPAPPRPITSVVDYHLPYDTHNLYDITFGPHTIHTVLTSSPPYVTSWLTQTLHQNPPHSYNRHRNNLIVGLDIEWRPNTRPHSNNPVATIQLCVGLSCLVFQILHSPYVPPALADFLGSPNHTFVGVGIQEDARKLLRNRSLRVSNVIDLRWLAVDVLRDRELRNSGLKTLSSRVLGVEMEKPAKIRRSKWDKVNLSAKQVQYACLDAFVSFEVGRRLLAYTY